MALRVPQREGKHSPELGYTIFAPARICLQDHFRIRVADELNPILFEPGAHFAEVINFTVVNEPVSCGGILHRLVA
jgi:hypothetical protein